MENVPVILFAYRRADVLAQTLAALRANNIPRLIVYSDGARDARDGPGVDEVRQCLSRIDWCAVERHDRTENRGLGKNILAGVTEALETHEAVLVWEDDLICVPGTYAYLCRALEAYRDDRRVTSVTGWTNRHVTPADAGDRPYFDGRAECWVWGTWRRAWAGMAGETALQKLAAARAWGVPPAKYGGDLPYMAKQEEARNIWAVRFLYHHLQHGGLCMRPPWSLVEHIGFDPRATNAAGVGSWLANGPLRPCPPLPSAWPEPVENPRCAALHRRMCPRPWSDRFPAAVKAVRFLRNTLRKGSHG